MDATAVSAGFKIVRMEGNAVTQTVRDADPNRAWIRLPMEGNQLRARKIRERQGVGGGRGEVFRGGRGGGVGPRYVKLHSCIHAVFTRFFIR